MRLSHPLAAEQIFFPPRGTMLFAAGGRGPLLVMPRPLSGCQIKAEIKGFRWCIVCFCTSKGSFRILKKAGEKFSKKDYFHDFLKWQNYKKYFLQRFSNFLKEWLLVQKQTIHQQKSLDFSFHLPPWKWAWHYQEAARPSRRKKHILFNLKAARWVFDFLTSMTSIEVNFKDTSTFRVSFESWNKGLFVDVMFVSIVAIVLSEYWKALDSRNDFRTVYLFTIVKGKFFENVGKKSLT